MGALLEAVLAGHTPSCESLGEPSREMSVERAKHLSHGRPSKSWRVVRRPARRPLEPRRLSRGRPAPGRSALPVCLASEHNTVAGHWSYPCPRAIMFTTGSWPCTARSEPDATGASDRRRTRRSRSMVTDRSFLVTQEPHPRGRSPGRTEAPGDSGSDRDGPWRVPCAPPCLKPISRPDAMETKRLP